MNIKEQPVLSTANLQIGYHGKRGVKAIVADKIGVGLHSGEMICLLGPNGSGKSTLIKTLAGMLPGLDGSMALFGEDISAMSPKEIAKKLSTVLTDRISIGNLTVYNLVAFGRSPYTGWLGTLSGKDKQKVRWAIHATGLTEFVGRDISKLSDGERQKVMIARALAQDTSVILLDEPTAHLDLPNRVEIIRLLRRLAHETGKGILLSTHELDLALKAADQIWLMNREKSLVTGVPEDLVLNGTFEHVFAQDGFDFDRATGSFNIHQKKDKVIALTGDPVPVFWTQRALEREGFNITGKNEAGLKVEATDQNGGYRWQVQRGNNKIVCTSIKELIKAVRREKYQ